MPDRAVAQAELSGLPRHEHPSAGGARLSLVGAPQAAYVVTTLDDVIDGADGVLSLREAVATANLDPGRDTITFADSLRGQSVRIDLEQGPLRITAPLTIDGDPLDRGPGGIVLDARPDDPFGQSPWAPGVFEVNNAAARFEDLTLSGWRGVSAGIQGAGADATVEVYRSLVASGRGEDGYNGTGIGAAVVRFVESELRGISGVENTNGIVGGTVEIIDSTISGIGGDSGTAIAGGDLLLMGSTVTGVGLSFGGELIRGERVAIVNSTLAFNRVENEGDNRPAIEGAESLTIVNSTVVDNGNPQSIAGLRGGDIVIANSVVMNNGGELGPNIDGRITSNGYNIFSEPVDGARATDVEAATFLQIFADRQLRDNGGPTTTLGLLNSDGNPALDGGSNADAVDGDGNPLLFDQRGEGFARVVGAAVDIGAFEQQQPIATFDRGLTVTTLADGLVADGQVSLREAVLTAREQPGADTIGFDAGLAGGRIVLEGGRLFIDHDLTIDASSLAAPVVVDGDARGDVLTIEGAEVTLRGLGVENGAYAFTGDNTGSGIRATDATLFIEDSIIRGNAGADGGGIDARFSFVVLSGSRILDNDGSLAGGIAAYRSAVEIEDSTIAGNRGDQVGGLIVGSGSLKAKDISVIGNDGPRAGLYVPGSTFMIEGMTVAGNTSETKAYSSAVSLGPESEGSITNATIVDNRADAAVWAFGGSRAELTHLTITGNDGGLAVSGGSEVGLVNSIVLGNGQDILASGAGTLRLVASVTGDLGDLDEPSGITADQVFAQTKLVDGVMSGVLADNGGPTETVALLADPANPALNAADARLSPETDQRGELRDGDPDIGAFELGLAPVIAALPELVEKVALAPEDIRGVPLSQLTIGGGGDAVVSFVDEYAAFQNSLGVYLVGPEGEIVDVAWAFSRIEHAQASDLASPLARPGGGPLLPGDAVALSDLFDPADLAPGTAFGLFLVADGHDLNPGSVFTTGSLEFRFNDDVATIRDPQPSLVHVAADGSERLVSGDVFHAIDPRPESPGSNGLNPGGFNQATSGLLDGDFVVAFEDKSLFRASDRDFNDAIFAVRPAVADIATLVVDDTVA